MRANEKQQQFKINNLLITIIMIALMLTACGQTPQPVTSPLGAGDSPLVTPGATLVEEVQPFRLDKPLVAGMTRITGSGPAGIPVLIADVTMGGDILGSATIGRNGKFEIRLQTSLEAAHRIGLTIGDLTGTGKQYQDFQQEFYGDEAFLVPQVGFFFDTAMVRSQD